MDTIARRFQIRPHRVTGWYVLDTRTGAVRTGMVRVGAQQLADHLNRTTTYRAGDRVRDPLTNARGTIVRRKTVRTPNGNARGYIVDFDHGTTTNVLPEHLELICRADTRDEQAGPVWRDQQLTFGGTPEDAEQGALFAL